MSKLTVTCHNRIACKNPSCLTKYPVSKQEKLKLVHEACKMEICNKYDLHLTASQIYELVNKRNMRKSWYKELMNLMDFTWLLNLVDSNTNFRFQFSFFFYFQDPKYYFKSQESRLTNYSELKYCISTPTLTVLVLETLMIFSGPLQKNLWPLGHSYSSPKYTRRLTSVSSGENKEKPIWYAHHKLLVKVNLQQI